MAADINRVVLVGRLTRDAELKYSNNGLAICAFSVAVNSSRKQGDEWVEEANFFDVTVFGRQGEAIQRYLVKGQQVAVDGRLKQDRWQTQDGQNRSKVGVIADNVRLLGSPSGGGQGRAASGTAGGASGGHSGPSGGPDSGDDFPDQIPF
jgi:single-strand DNA-binding protein